MRGGVASASSAGVLFDRWDRDSGCKTQKSPHDEGSRFAGNSIIKATGAFAGRTGKAHMSGRHGGQDLPGFVSFDDFWLIELDPS